MKLDYSQSYKKKQVQKVVFSEAKQLGIKKLIGLAGPNITDYLSFVKSKGFKQAEVYEIDFTSMLYQMRDFQPPIQTKVLYQDIYHAPVYQDVIYDLDFCCTIKYASPHIKKFRDNKSIITLALRGVGLKETIKSFCKLVSKLKPDIKLNVLVNDNYKKHIIIFNEDVIYTLYEYRDTTQMLTIINF